MEENILAGIPKKFIDVENVIKSKNPKLLKALPKFIINYLKRILHEDFVNKFIETHGDKYDIDFADKIIEVFGATVKASGQENIPKSGGCILAANHPLGGLDGIAFIKSVGEIRKDVKFFANDILMNVQNLGGV